MADEVFSEYGVKRPRGVRPRRVLRSDSVGGCRLTASVLAQAGVQIAVAGEWNLVVHREKDSVVFPESVPGPGPALVLMLDS
ncbi:MAG: hypothetical protein NUV51_00690 [Sulfuricaulis sp.]|nr:hypothetical protein [Sulfuricaulis sp.]